MLLIQSLTRIWASCVSTRVSMSHVLPDFKKKLVTGPNHFIDMNVYPALSKPRTLDEVLLMF